MNNWMSNLDTSLKNKPLIYLAIPGSHDCMTYTITSSSTLSPDNDPTVQAVMKVFGKIIGKYFRKWCITQELGISEQLNIGIRYLDFRVATKPDNKIYFCHGLYGSEVSRVFPDINNFLDTNKEEVIVLDFQHFYGFNLDHHMMLINDMIKHAFGDKLCPYSEQIEQVTLKWMIDNGYRVIVIYRDKEIENRKIPGLWPGPAWPTLWPNTSSVNRLYEFVKQKLTTRPADQGFVTQCLLTPDAKMLILHPFGNLKSSCARPVLAKLTSWLKEQRPGAKGINVVIADFVQLETFPSLVVGLNNNMLKS